MPKQQKADRTKDRPEYIPTHPRMKRELKTIKCMIDIYCRSHHQSSARPCQICQELLSYATLRLQHCPFQENKTTCGNCSIHCYKPSYRDKIQEVMKYSGPRMLWNHPILAIGHLLDGFKNGHEIENNRSE